MTSFSKIYQIFKRVKNYYGFASNPPDFETQIENAKQKGLVIINDIANGPSFFYLFDFRTKTVFNVTGNTQKVVGLEQKEILKKGWANPLRLLQLKDLYKFVRSAFEYYSYIYSLPSEKRQAVRGMMLYTLKSKDKKERGIMHQNSIACFDYESGKVICTLNIITDISHINPKPDFKLFIQENINEEENNFFEVTLNIEGSKDEKQLTKAEINILNLNKEGLSTKEMAAKLSLSHHTINNHKKNILNKTNAKNMAEAVHNFSKTAR